MSQHLCLLNRDLSTVFGIPESDLSIPVFKPMDKPAALAATYELDGVRDAGSLMSFEVMQYMTSLDPNLFKELGIFTIYMPDFDHVLVYDLPQSDITGVAGTTSIGMLDEFRLSEWDSEQNLSRMYTASMTRSLFGKLNYGLVRELTRDSLLPAGFLIPPPTHTYAKYYSAMVYVTTSTDNGKDWFELPNPTCLVDNDLETYPNARYMTIDTLEQMDPELLSPWSQMIIAGGLRHLRER